MPDQNQSPIAAGNQMPVMPPEPQKSGVGPVAGAIIVILLLIAGGLYFWGAKLNEKAQENSMPYIPSNDAPPAHEADMQTTVTDPMLPPQSDSDDPSSIEADFNAMDFDRLEAENETELDSIY